MAKSPQRAQQPKPQWRRTFIREWREHRGMTLAELAAKMDMNEGYLSELENGKRRYNQDILEAASEALGVPQAYLLSRKPIPDEKTLDLSDPYVAASIMDTLDESERRRLGAIIKTFTRSD